MGFEMLQVLEDNFRPSSISNTFTTLLSLFNNRQSDTEGIHKFCLQFVENLSALSCLLVAIPQILQVMLFLRAIYLRYCRHRVQLVRRVAQEPLVRGSKPLRC
jgi:hypothetical protein